MELPSKLQKKDVIVIPYDKITSVFEWRNNNQDIVRKFTPILEDLVIKVANIAIHVEVSTRPYFSYQFTVYDRTVKVLFQHWNRHTMEGDIEFNRLPQDILKDDEAVKDYAQSVISLYCTLMAYMEHHREVVTQQDVRTQRPQDPKKKKKKKKQVTYLRKTIYTFSGTIKTDPEANTLEKGKRGYTAPTEPFKVHGHWRHYKSGKKVWVSGYVKNKQEGKEPDPKVYQV